MHVVCWEETREFNHKFYNTESQEYAAYDGIAFIDIQVMIVTRWCDSANTSPMTETADDADEEDLII